MSYGIIVTKNLNLKKTEAYFRLSLWRLMLKSVHEQNVGILVRFSIINKSSIQIMPLLDRRKSLDRARYSVNYRNTEWKYFGQPKTGKRQALAC